MSFIIPFLVLALMVVVAIMIKRTTMRIPDKANSVNGKNVSNDEIDYIDFLLKRSGYNITHHGVGVAHHEHDEWLL